MTIFSGMIVMNLATSKAATKSELLSTSRPQRCFFCRLDTSYLSSHCQEQLGETLEVSQLVNKIVFNVCLLWFLDVKLNKLTIHNESNYPTRGQCYKTF